MVPQIPGPGRWPSISVRRMGNGVRRTATVDAVKGAGSVVRGAQSGFVRAYALLLIGGFAALGIYFLVVAN